MGHEKLASHSLVQNLQVSSQTTLDSDPDPLQSERTKHLVTQLGIMESRLLYTNIKVRIGMIKQLVSRFQDVFTDGEVAVG